MPGDYQAHDTHMAAAGVPTLAVLVGAGASAKAGVPTTLKFVDGFRERLDSSDPITKTYDELIAQLRQGAKSTSPPKLVDVEAVLSALETIRNPTVVDWALARRGTFGPSDRADHLKVIRKRLRDFIRDQCLVRPEATEYLLPLIQLSNAFRPLPVFSVNYDVVIEQFLDSHGISYVDGFELRFDPTRFDEPESEVRLYKLHGSVTWFRGRTGGYMKLPIRSSLRGVELLSGERAEPVMLYPAEKADYAGPFLELFRRFQETLRHCEWLIVLGYSFRDPILRDLVIDAAVSNPKLKIILVCGRKTEAIYADSLASRISEVPDSRSQKGAVIRDRIVRLPFRVESALPDFVSAIFPSLQRAMMSHSTSIWAELHGEAPQWPAAAEGYLRSGVLAQGSAIYEKHVESDPLQQDQDLKFAGLLAISNFASGNVGEGDAYWDDLVAELNLWLVRRLSCSLSVRPAAIYFRANWHQFPAGNLGGIDYVNAGKLIEDIARVGSVVLRCLDEDEPADYLRPKIKNLSALSQYLTGVGNTGYDLKRYLTEKSEIISVRLLDRVTTILAPEFNAAEEPAGFQAAESAVARIEAKYLRNKFIRRL